MTGIFVIWNVADPRNLYFKKVIPPSLPSLYSSTRANSAVLLAAGWSCSTRLNILFLSCLCYLNVFGQEGAQRSNFPCKTELPKKKKKWIYFASNEMNFSSEIPDLETTSVSRAYHPSPWTSLLLNVLIHLLCLMRLLTFYRTEGKCVTRETWSES